MLSQSGRGPFPGIRTQRQVLALAKSRTGENGLFVVHVAGGRAGARGAGFEGRATLLL